MSVKPYLIVIILILCLADLYAQTKGENSRISNGKNILYITPGFIPDLFTTSLSYEHLLSTNKPRHSFALKAELGGLIGSLIEPAIFAGPQLTYLLGKESSKIEASIGGSALYVFNNNELLFIPTGVLGIRYQSKAEKLIFRIGVGFPNGLYLSGGLKF